ncbi:MAG TPA: AMP-binding protein [Gammaproteobacteria bacterium]|nr:AMP-binding protein [Gammaproteobacteria bacterium]
MFRSAYADVDIPNRSLSDFVLGEAHEHSGKPALADNATGVVLTYGQLLDRVRRAAAGLAALGIAKGDVVALSAPNSPEFAVAFHAIVRLGAVVTPVNPANTSHEIAQQLKDSGAKLLVASAALADKAHAAIHEAARPIDVVTIDGGAVRSRSLESIAIDGEPPQVRIDPATDVVVLPYSSGTTGLPKGVMLTHRNLVANLAQLAAIERHDLTALVGVLPFFHIYGMVVIMNFGLMRGLTVVTMPKFEFEPFLKVLQDWRIELAHIVPPVAIALAKHPLVDNYDLSHLRWLLSAAAPLGTEVTNAIEARLGVRMRQGYGMTEASPASHYTGPDERRPGKTGTLVPNTECRIVCTETGRDLGTNEAGEVWVRGPQVMKGYLNNPEATARTVDAEGWLHTGDIGVVDDEGYLLVVDRLKELIKVKGFQVAPAELESLLLKHPSVADAAVIGVPDDEAGEVPKAIVVAREPLTAADVIAFVHAEVAHYKRIRHVEFVDAIPKSASGKILRRVLVDRERARR